jgi:hypothetical protein
MDTLAAAWTCAILWGGGIFLLTLLAALAGHGEHLILLANYYLGYSISIAGAFIGLLWAALDGFILGLLGALIYNRLLDWRQRV